MQIKSSYKKEWHFRIHSLTHEKDHLYFLIIKLFMCVDEFCAQLSEVAEFINSSLFLTIHSECLYGFPGAGW